MDALLHHPTETVPYRMELGMKHVGLGAGTLSLVLVQRTSPLTSPVGFIHAPPLNGLGLRLPPGQQIARASTPS